MIANESEHPTCTRMLKSGEKCSNDAVFFSEDGEFFCDEHSRPEEDLASVLDMPKPEGGGSIRS